MDNVRVRIIYVFSKFIPHFFHVSSSTPFELTLLECSDNSSFYFLDLYNKSWSCQWDEMEHSSVTHLKKMDKEKIILGECDWMTMAIVSKGKS